MNTDRATTTGAGIQGGVRGDLQVMRAKMQRNTGALQLMAGQGSLEAALALKEIVDGNAYKESMLRTSAMQNPNTNSVVAQLGAKADNFQQGAQYPGTARYADGGLVRGYAGGGTPWFSETVNTGGASPNAYHWKRKDPKEEPVPADVQADRDWWRKLIGATSEDQKRNVEKRDANVKAASDSIDSGLGTAGHYGSRALRALGVGVPRVEAPVAKTSTEYPEPLAAREARRGPPTAREARRGPPTAGLVAAAGAGAGAGAGGDTYAGVESSGPPKTSTAPSLGAGATPAAAAAVQSDANTLLSSLDKLRSREKELNEKQRVALQEKADAAIKRLSEATNTPWKKLVQWADNTLAARRANPTARGLAVAGLGAAASRGQDEARKGQIDTIQADLAEKNRLINMADVAAERGNLEGAYKLRAQADEVAQKRKKQEADIRYTDAQAVQAGASAKKSEADARQADRHVQPVQSGRAPRSMAMTQAQREAAIDRYAKELKKEPEHFQTPWATLRKMAEKQYPRGGGGGGTAPAAPAGAGGWGIKLKGG